jgi:segregation and condensation protein B
MTDSFPLESPNNITGSNDSPEDNDNQVDQEESLRELDKSSSILASLEALLFIAPGPVTLNQLATAYVQEGSQRGIRLQRFGGQLQLTTAPEIAPIIERFLGMEISSRLSRASMETLAIVMYKQPVTRPQIDGIRGVNSDAVLRSLLLKGLVQEIGRAESPGRPILYSITPECLQSFGLSSLAQLPPLELEESGRSE